MVSEDLEIKNPVMLFDAPPEIDGFCVLTRSGKILLVRDAERSVDFKEVLNLSGMIGSLELELGALGAAFGPKEFGSGQERYRHLLVYSAFSDGEVFHNRLQSFEVSLPSLTVRQDSSVVLIDQLDPTAMHNGGELSFGPDGYLCLGLGDGGPENDGSRFSQVVDGGLFSGILRIDIYGDDPDRVKPIENQPRNGETRNYWIPRDNPFVGVPDALEEFWAIGLRNPFRFSFHPDGKSVIVGDVGQSYYEEVNIVRAGANCQWSYREGLLSSKLSYHRGQRPDPFVGVETLPEFWYRNSQKRGCVIGGAIYTGGKFNDLVGHYIFGDSISGEVFALPLGDRESGAVLPSPVLSSAGETGRALSRLTDIYFRGDDVLFCRLGSGKGGSTLMRLTESNNDSSINPVALEVTGEENYEAFCSRCHGAAGIPPESNAALGLPTARGFSNIEWQSTVSDLQIEAAIRNGVRKEGSIVMPSWEEALDDSSIKALVQVIREFGNTSSSDPE